MEQITILGIAPTCKANAVTLPNFGIEFYGVHSAIKSKCEARFNDLTTDGKVKVFVSEYYYALTAKTPANYRLTPLENGKGYEIEGKPYYLARVLMDKHLQALTEFCELNNMVLWSY